jgi:hypothetical protein
VLDLSVQIRGVDEMQRQLETLAKRSVPFAARETLNTLAFEGRKIWQGEMRDSLTLRNRFTERRALVETARGLRIETMEATLGHTEPYMALLEHGKPERAAKRFRPIPTEHAAGQAKGSLAGGRKRPVRKPLNIRGLGSLKFKRSGRGRKADNARAVQHAIKSGKRLALLDMGKRKGIYRVIGSKRNPEIRKLYDLTKSVTPMPKIPTLQRTLTKTLLMGPSVAHDALLKQLKRNGIAGY